MVLKTISPGCGVRASLMLFFLVFYKSMSLITMGGRLWEEGVDSGGVHNLSREYTL